MGPLGISNGIRATFISSPCGLGLRGVYKHMSNPLLTIYSLNCPLLGMWGHEAYILGYHGLVDAWGITGTGYMQGDCYCLFARNCYCLFAGTCRRSVFVFLADCRLTLPGCWSITILLDVVAYTHPHQACLSYAMITCNACTKNYL